MLGLWLVGVWPAVAAGAQLELEGSSSSNGNCMPFGAGGGGYTGFKGFIYAGLPALCLGPGDVIAFDHVGVNDTTINVDIALARTTVSGGTMPDADGFVTVVDGGIPLDPNGNTIIGDYELAFTVDDTFCFDGGGLIVRFEPVGGFAADGTCSAGVGGSLASDPSGSFVARFWGDADGEFPFAITGDNSIGNVRFTYATDHDGDGVGDFADNCPFAANAGQADADADEAGDACDPCPHDPDDDGDEDGVCGDVDNCVDVANANQLDGDGDGAGDVCDVCGNDPLDDADVDGLCADVDNCPATANADQLDSDADAVGDACDLCPLDPEDDADADGLCAGADNCPEVANPDQLDQDGDGAGDACSDEPAADTEDASDESGDTSGGPPYATGWGDDDPPADGGAADPHSGDAPPLPGSGLRGGSTSCECTTAPRRPAPLLLLALLAHRRRRSRKMPPREQTFTA